jgi:signal peptidase I
LQKPQPIRLAFVGLWFVAVPALLAYLAVQLLSGDPTDLTVGVLRTFVRDQPLPAGIILFTAFEMTLWRFRHDLPLASRLSVGGRVGLPTPIRRKFEGAVNLLDEAERIQSAHRKAIERTLPASEREKLDRALRDLRQAMDAEPFDGAAFEERLEAASAVLPMLGPWRKGELREYVESIGLAILVALLLRAVVVEAFKIPSGSMLPTLQIEDHIFVNKFVYGPTIPFSRTRVLPRLPPRRGDVIVFEYPDPDASATPQDYIKRVIGLPGDVLEAHGGHPIINGFAVPYCRAGVYERPDRRAFGSGPLELHVEFIGEHAFLTLVDPHQSEDHEGPYQIVDDEVWVFGDNRHNSSDSRAWNGGRGAGVPYANVKGRAMFVWLPLSRLFVNVMGSPLLPKGAPAELVRGVEKCLEQRPTVADSTPPPPKLD